MRSYLVRGDQITALPAVPSSVPAGATLVQSPADLESPAFPQVRLASLWNALPGAEPVKRFKDRPSAIKRLWAALEAIPAKLVRADSKQARLIELLRRPEGASIDELVAATGWQPHSIRGALSGVLRKRLGLTVSSNLTGKTRTYRIDA